MIKLSYIIGPRPSSYPSFEAFKKEILQIKDMGYSGVEIGIGIPLGFEINQMNEFLSSIDFPVVSVMSGINAFDDGMFLSVPDADERKKAVHRLQELIPVVKQLNAVMVIGSMLGNSGHEPDRKVGEARIIECLKQVAETAEKYKQKIVLEPMAHFCTAYNHTLTETNEMIASIGSSYFKPMLDTIHMNVEEKSMVEAIHRAGADLGHVHLCETNGDIAGTGHMDYVNVFKALEEINYEGWTSLKVYRTDYPEGAVKSIQYLKSLGLV